MSDDNMVEIDTRPLDKLLKALKTDKRVKVGILGDGQARTEGAGRNANNATATNAEIGVKHEFGQDGMPIRSFLRWPLIQKFQSYVTDSKAFSPKVVQEIARTGKVDELMKKIGIIAETVVMDAFQTGGWGMWKPSNFKLKKNHQTLVETQQLRNSITSKVDE